MNPAWKGEEGTDLSFIRSAGVKKENCSEGSFKENSSRKFLFEDIFST